MLHRDGTFKRYGINCKQGQQLNRCKDVFVEEIFSVLHARTHQSLHAAILSTPELLEVRV
jgi:hypothetical protein